MSHADALDQLIAFGYAEYVKSDRGWAFEDIPESGSDVVPDSVMKDLFQWGLAKKEQREVGPPGAGVKGTFAVPTPKGEKANRLSFGVQGRFRKAPIVYTVANRHPRSKEIQQSPGGRRVYFPYAGRGQGGEPHLSWGAPSKDPDAAYRAAEQDVKKYKQDHWPGGFGTVVAIADQGLGFGSKRFVGLANFGYSPS